VADRTASDVGNYSVELQQGDRIVDLDSVSSPGGSFEGGYDTTTFSSPLIDGDKFLFEIHPEDFLNKIGKMFGMQDVVTGFPEFDENVIVKTNDPARFKSIFGDRSLREIFQSLSGYNFRIVQPENKERHHLELFIQRAITDSTELRDLFKAYFHVLENVQEI
jgi:hypothetical protein